MDRRFVIFCAGVSEFNVSIAKSIIYIPILVFKTHVTTIQRLLIVFDKPHHRSGEPTILIVPLKKRKFTGTNHTSSVRTKYCCYCHDVYLLYLRHQNTAGLKSQLIYVLTNKSSVFVNSQT